MLPITCNITNAYDGNAPLLFTKLFTSGGSLLDASTYGYNAGNQRTGVTRTDGSTVGYTYDDIGQLKIADSSVSGEDRGYAYDPAWNLRNRTNNGVNQNFHVNGKNELTNYTYGGFCTYDANGNLTNRVNGTWQYGYDDENQLVQMTNYSGSTPVTWTRLMYDGRLRLRVRQEYTWIAMATNPEPDSLTMRVGGKEGAAVASPGGGSSPWQLASETRYIYDGMRVIQERDQYDVPVVSYTRGTDLSGSLEGAGGIGGLLARSHGYSGGSWSTHNCYHADGNGNVTYLVDSSQTLAASYRYDAYGNTLAASGSLAAANVYRFSSKEVHGLTGLYYYGYRWYAPELQRWVNRDPLGNVQGVDGPFAQVLLIAANTYPYTFIYNDPVVLQDSDGRGVVGCISAVKAWRQAVDRAEAAGKVAAKDQSALMDCINNAISLGKCCPEKTSVAAKVKACRGECPTEYAQYQKSKDAAEKATAATVAALANVVRACIGIGKK